MFVPIVTLGLLGVTLTALLRIAERHVAPWTAASQGRLIDLAGPKGRRKEHTCRTGINRFMCRRSLRACSRWRMPVALPRRRPARPCARSTSGSRLRRRTVHTAPYVAKELGFFARRCIDANIIQFEGGQSATANAAAVQGSAIVVASTSRSGAG